MKNPDGKVSVIVADAEGPKGGKRYVLMECTRNAVARFYYYGDAEGLNGFRQEGTYRTVREALKAAPHARVYRAKIHRYEGLSDIWEVFKSEESE